MLAAVGTTSFSAAMYSMPPARSRSPRRASSSRNVTGSMTSPRSVRDIIERNSRRCPSRWNIVSSRISAALSAASWSSIMAPRTACSASLLHGVCRPANSVVEDASGDTDVIPGWSLPMRVTQQGRRVIGHHDRNAAEAMDLVAERSERLFGVEQRLCRCPTHRLNGLRFHELDLTIEKRQAGRDLVVLRQPILGGPALHDVADEHLVPRQFDRFENLGEQLPRPTDEGTSRFVFRASGAFADYHQAGGGRTFAGDRLGSSVAKLARATIRDERRDVLKTARLLEWIGREQIDGGRIE